MKKKNTKKQHKNTDDVHIHLNLEGRALEPQLTELCGRHRIDLDNWGSGWVKMYVYY